MTREQDGIVLEIRDDGQGFDPSMPGRGFGPRFGLQSMRERVESIHGTFAVRSTAGQGTTVRIEVPLIYRGEDA
jgi:signal transduction histidine kinase